MGESEGIYQTKTFTVFFHTKNLIGSLIRKIRDFMMSCHVLAGKNFPEGLDDTPPP